MKIDPQYGQDLRCGRHAALLVAVSMVALTAVGGLAAGAQETVDYFRQNCVSCHTIGGGRLVGPDLKGVMERQERQWLLNFIVDPQGALGRGDPYALKLKQAAGGAVMPKPPGITRDRAEALLQLIEAESLLEESQFIGLDISDEPFTLADIDNGRRIFLGTRQLTNHGPACVSCHTVGSLGGLSGGRLGPDLTRAYERLQGRKGLAAWMLAPATDVMRPVFSARAMTNEEIVPLVAFLEAEARLGTEDPGTSRVTFLLFGLAGVVLSFVVADGLWRHRFRAVRRPLVVREKL